MKYVISSIRRAFCSLIAAWKLKWRQVWELNLSIAWTTLKLLPPSAVLPFATSNRQEFDLVGQQPAMFTKGCIKIVCYSQQLEIVYKFSQLTSSTQNKGTKASWTLFNSGISLDFLIWILSCILRDPLSTAPVV